MKTIKNKKVVTRNRIKRKIRAKVFGTQERPRMSVFRSNAFIYVQIIDDTTGRTLVAASDAKETKGTKTERARAVGKTIATDAKKAGISAVTFDRNGFKYTGRVSALADAAREGGLAF